MNGSDITWFRQNMLAHRFAALSDADTDRFQRLMNGNPICQGFWQLFQDEESRRGAGEHLPQVIVDNWALAHRFLEGGERQLVREHLHHCDDCGQLLESLGWIPEMSAEPAEVKRRNLVTDLADHAAWILERASAGAGALARSLSELVPQGFSIQPLLVPVATTRGTEIDEQVQVIDPAAPLVNLLLAPVHWEGRTRMTIRIILGGATLHELQADPPSPPQDFLILTYLNSPLLEAGSYTFELIPWRDGQPQPREKEVRLLRIEHRS
jgi:hypothetical protein